jgi:hypothetical protein
MRAISLSLTVTPGAVRELRWLGVSFGRLIR